MGLSGGTRGFADVLASARDGDESAFAALWRWLQPSLLRWLTVVAPDNVEDVASEVWLSVTRGLSSFDGDEAGFRGWVFTIARRRAVDWARRRRRQVPVAAIEGVDVLDPVATSTPMEDRAALDAALAMLRRLTPDQGEVVGLRVIVGLTVSETAAVVQKTEGAVRVLCHRGLQTLAQRLDAERLHRGVTA